MDSCVDQAMYDANCKYECMINGIYGEVLIPKTVFLNLRTSLIIQPRYNDSIVYMCANDEEVSYLKSFGVVINKVTFDYFKLICV